MEFFEEGNMSPTDLAAYDRFVDARRVAESVKKTQLRIGMEQGLEQGKAQTQQKIALNLLSQLSIEAVALATGLSIEEVTKLKNRKK